MRDRKLRGWSMRSLVVFSLCLLMVTPSALAAEQSASSGSGWKDAVVTPVFNWFNVKGDKGRFRQDSRVKDGFSAGVEEVSATTADEKVSLDAYAISETDYGHTLKVKLSDSENLEIKGKYFRQYYDGSNEPWNANVFCAASSRRRPANWAGDRSRRVPISTV